MEAKEWGIPNDEFARGVLAKQYSAERYSFYAERCWYLLMEAGREHSVDKVDVIYDVSAGKFFCELWRGAVSKRFALDARLVSEPFERGDMAALDHAKESIRFAVEQVFEQDEHLAELRTGP